MQVGFGWIMSTAILVMKFWKSVPLDRGDKITVIMEMMLV